MKFITGCQQKPALGFHFVFGYPKNCRCRPSALTCDLHLGLPHHINSLASMTEARILMVKECFGLVMPRLCFIGYNRWRYSKQHINVTEGFKTALFVVQILRVLDLWIGGTHHCCIFQVMKLIFRDHHNDLSSHTMKKYIYIHRPDCWN